MNKEDIENLPTDKKMNLVDKNVIKEIFNSQSDSKTKLGIKKSIILIVVFILLNIPFVDNFIKKRISESNTVVISIKTIIFIIIIIVLNFY